MGKLYSFLTFLLCSSAALYGQCADIQTVSVCDMTVVDGNNDGTPDGIINLYDELSIQTGTTITAADGMWFDPNFNFALDVVTGDLFLWDLDSSSEMDTDYQFEFLNTSSGCPGDVEFLFNVVLGPYSGTVATTMDGAINLQVCQPAPPSECMQSTSIDLFQTMSSNPSPHSNGEWTYEGTSPNFVGITGDRFLNVNIPYQSGPPLVDEETFEVIYTVPGITPCAPEQVTTVRVSVVREPFAGFANQINICETALIAGDFDTDLNLLDDTFLVNENTEGIWLEATDSTGQISGPGDSTINLSEIYDDLVAGNPRFGSETFEFQYFVESRSTICGDATSTVGFTFYEYVRPFSQNTDFAEFCAADASLTTVNLYDYVEFTTEDGTLFDYPNNAFTNWTLVSGPSELGLISNTGDIATVGEDPEYTSQGTIDLSNLDPLTAAGTYVFEFTVDEEYNAVAEEEEIFETPDGCTSTTSSNHPCDTQTTQITIVISNPNYAGEDTADLAFCESEGTLVLTDLLQTDGVQTVYVGPEGEWTDGTSGDVILNNFVIPEITGGSQEFSFLYTTVTAAGGCVDTATLSFTVFEQFDPGEDGPVVVCADGGVVDLFTLLGGTPDTNGTWSGPDGYTSDTNVALFDPSTDTAGDYIYTVPANGPCVEDSATINVTIGEANYAGEDTTGVELCDTVITNPLDLITLLETNGVDTIYVGADGTWTDTVTGDPIVNPFTIPAIDGQQTFEFTYSTTTANNCEDIATLSFIVFEQGNAGTSALYETCEDGIAVDLFTLLTDNPDTTGTWSGPDGYTTTDSSAPFNPAVNAEGVYTYTVPANGACDEVTATVSVDFLGTNYAGEDTTGLELCDGTITNPVDLITLLDTNGVDTIYTGPEGAWTDTVTGDPITNPFTFPTIIGQQAFNFTYTTTTTDGCGDSATLSFTIFEEGNAGIGDLYETCEDGTAVDLFTLLTDNPDTTGTWSGPDGYTTTNNNAPFDPAANAEGDYTYTVPANGACDAVTAIVSVDFFGSNYAGEDTTGVELCDATVANPVDLVSLLETNGVDTVYTGPQGTWTDTVTGAVIANPFTIPTITGSQTFDFTYTTTSDDNCGDSSSLSFTVFESGDAGTGATYETCEDGVAVDLFTLLTDNPDTTGTWSGPNGYTTTDNNAPFDPAANAEGDYTYTVPANGACPAVIAIVSVDFFDVNYAGEDTDGVEVCETEGVVNLLVFIQDNSPDTIFIAGEFTDTATGDPFANPFTFPAIDGQQTFDVTYTTTSSNGCIDQATLSFTVFEQEDAGISASIELCQDAGVLNLFDELNGTPDASGTWSGPEGYTSATSDGAIDPMTAADGDYIYTIAANGACDAVTATVAVTIVAASNAGENVNTFLCPGDYTTSLFDLLSADAQVTGEFIDLATSLAVPDGIVDVAVLGSGNFSYLYLVTNDACGDDDATITFDITPVAAPTVSFNKPFICINDGVTLEDLIVSVDNFNWYAFAEAGDPLSLSTLLVDNTTYYVSAVDANECESIRVAYTADINPLSDGRCQIQISDGVSDNDDGLNDDLDLGTLPNVFPNFDIQIFNRYGTIVYRGNRNTPLFDGSSNTGSGLGDQLPTGVYFYIFYPNDLNSEPIDGTFYLSR